MVDTNRTFLTRQRLKSRFICRIADVKKKKTPFWQQPVTNRVYPSASPRYAFHAKILMLFQEVTLELPRGTPGSNKYLEKFIFRSILGHEKLRSG
jgi:hypothetical protein